jgi:TonB family protein
MTTLAGIAFFFIFKTRSFPNVHSSLNRFQNIRFESEDFHENLPKDIPIEKEIFSEEIKILFQKKLETPLENEENSEKISFSKEKKRPPPRKIQDLEKNPLPEKTIFIPDITSPAKALDMKNLPPSYPLLARRKGFEGRVLLLVNVDIKGKVEDILIVESSGHRILDRSALEAVKKWEFQAARKNGMPVKGEILIPIRFRLKGP